MRRLNEWKHGPTTSILIKDLEYKKEQLTNMLATGGLKSYDNPMVEYARVIGQLEFIDFILEGGFLNE